MSISSTLISSSSSNSINGSQMNAQLKAQIFDTYASVNKTLSIKTQNSALAHDVTMDAIEKAINKSATFDSTKASVRTWVQSIAMRTLLDHYRSHAVSRTSSGFDSTTLDTMMGGYEIEYGESSVESTDFWVTVQSSMNAKQYNCIVARFRDDMSYKEIASDLNIPIGSVMSSISGGKKALKSSTQFASLFSQLMA